MNLINLLTPFLKVTAQGQPIKGGTKETIQAQIKPKFNTWAEGIRNDLMLKNHKNQKV